MAAARIVFGTGCRLSVAGLFSLVRTTPRFRIWRGCTIFSDDLARWPIGVKTGVLFIDSCGTSQVAASSASQNDIAGAYDCNLMTDIYNPIRAWPVNDASRRSRLSAIVRGAGTRHLHRGVNNRTSGVAALRIRTRRYRF